MSAAAEPMRGAWRRTAAAWAVCICAGVGAASAGLLADARAATDEITPAEHLIFTTEHLRGIAPQTELDYAMVHSGRQAGGTDTVRVLVVSADNAKGDAQVSDKSGAVQLPSGGLPCNPVILYFLERDIAQMEHLTGGQRRYFQKRVRLALAAGPAITPVTSQVGGKPVGARQVVIQPYLNDPNGAHFEQYTGKRYTFVLADAVPGQVAMIRTDVPGANNDFAHPLQTETLTFQSALHSLPAKPGSAPAKPPNAPRASR